MSFVYPGFLWAFFLLLIPIIVHLFNFRRYKIIYFSRVKFLQEVVDDSKTGAKLKHLLVLISRLLFLSCLILAFAQPFIPSKEGEKMENLTSIYIDNSYSMQAEGLDGDLLNEVKNQAIDIVKSLENNEKVNFLTGDMQSIHQRYYSKSEVIDMIKEVDFTPKSTQLKEILRLQSDILINAPEAGNSRIFVLSDFQKNTNKLKGLDIPEVQTYFYRAEAVNDENIYIDSVWFESPVHRTNSPVDVHFRVQNSSDQDLNDLTIRLSINGNELGPKRIAIPANSFIDDQITFTDRTPGNKSAKLAIATSQLFFDDTYYFTYTIKEAVNILLISSKNETTNNLLQLYNLDEYYNATATTIETVTPDEFNDKELVILNNIDKIPSGIMELMDYNLKNGATVVLIPGPALDRPSWNNYLGKHQLPLFGNLDTANRTLNYFNADDPLYSGVFEKIPENYRRSEVFSDYSLQITSKQNFITLFGASQRNPYLLYCISGNGKIFLTTSPLKKEFTDFQNHAIPATTFFRIAETATFEKPLYMTIGRMDNFPLQKEVSEKNPIHLLNELDGVDVIPLVTNISNSSVISFSHLEKTINEAGFYQLTDHQKFNETIALNYDRNESSTEVFSNDQIVEEFKNINWPNVSAFELTSKGRVQINQLKATEYWRILLILGLIFIGIEILLLKLWKR